MRVWLFGTIVCERNLEKRQKITKKALSEPLPAPLLRLPTTFTRWQVGPGLPHILFFEGRTHILTFGPPKGVPEWKNHLKTAYSLL